MSGASLHDNRDTGLTRNAVIFYAALFAIDLIVVPTVWSWRVWLVLHGVCFVLALVMFGWEAHRAGDDVELAEREAVG